MYVFFPKAIECVRLYLTFVLHIKLTKTFISYHIIYQQKIYKLHVDEEKNLIKFNNQKKKNGL